MALQILGKAADFLWGTPLMLFLLGTGIACTIRLGFPQRHIPKAIRQSLYSGQSDGHRPFSALMLHLAATLGVGNITGVAAAIAVGGAGSVLWCWLSGMLGIATAYAETRSALAFCPHTVSPMHALSAIGRHRCAALYALALASSGLFIGAMLPSNAIVSTLPTPAPLSGCILSLLTALVILGGVRRISRACEQLVPAVMLLFTAGCVGILWINRSFIPEALQNIFQSAFDLRAAAGGLLGSAAARAMRCGIARGVFSNEAGMGTSAVTIGTLRQGSAHERAMVSAAAVFWDTVVFCALTGLSFVTAAAARPELLEITDGAALSLQAFSSVPLGPSILRLCLIVLGFCCMIGWCFVGGRGFVYLCPKHERLYCLLWCLGILLGAFLQEEVLWTLADLLNICVILPSLYAIWLYQHKHSSPDSNT